MKDLNVWDLAKGLIVTGVMWPLALSAMVILLLQRRS